MTMDILLPLKHTGERETIQSRTRQLIIIGANGSGKTRFTERLIKDLEGHSFRVSALDALYDSRESDTLPGSIDMQCQEELNRTAFMRTDITSEFERLMVLLLHEEVLNLIKYKVDQTIQPGSKLQSTRLDMVIKLWQEIFPDNRILFEGGKMLFSRRLDKDTYSSVKLSAGEKAVLYYIGAILFAMENAVIFVDNPGIFLHPSILKNVWNSLEELRPDCTFIYTTHDLEFASSRTNSAIVWVRGYDAQNVTWDYDVLPPHSGLSEDIYLAIIGSRKPVLFIEGDETHSIDSKLYPLIFTEYTVKSLGSCNKVIEATRTFNDLNTFHHMDSYGIVDRDRRNANEVSYLRNKKIYVPDVAEIENILMLEDVIKTVARHNGKDGQRVFNDVKSAVMTQFKQEVRQQAMQHTRHKVKRTFEYRVDGKFTNINALEDHITDLVAEINPRGTYEAFCREFHGYVEADDYQSVLRVFNQKTMISTSNVANRCGVSGGKDGYVKEILKILKSEGRDALIIRRAIIRCFGITDTTPRQE